MVLLRKRYCLILLWVQSLEASAQELQVVKNLMAFEDSLLSIDSIGAGKHRELSPISKANVPAKDGHFIVDRMQGKDGATWLRARGIQYAEHPIADLRWQPPMPKKADLKTPVDATQWGDDCVQGPLLSRLESIQGASMSESCLYLNVWAPEVADNEELLPVLLWFHGGAFELGGTTSYNADGILSHRRDAVVVTTNYRLGALGFLGGKAVAKDTVDGSSGNFGLQDTRMAMKWVQRNIAAFGGDPQRVTIFGESAGASMVETHLSAPRSNGLFRNAIMQSGAFDNYTIQSDPEGTFADFATQAGCKPDAADVMQCLRKTPLFGNPGEHTSHALMPAIEYANKMYGFGPTIDHTELTESPQESAMAGRLNKVAAAIMGTTLDEGRFLMPLQMPVNNGPLASRADFHDWLLTFYPGAADAIAKQYRSSLDRLTPWEAAALVFTDSQYLCPTQRSAQWLAEAGAETFVYRLEYKPSIFDKAARISLRDTWCADFSFCDNLTLIDPGVGHSADVYMLFHDSGLNATDYAVGDVFVDYWMNFATSGYPSKGPADVAEWPSYLPGNTTMALRPSSAPVSNLRASYCDFWAGIHSGNPPSHRSSNKVASIVV